MHCIIEVRGAKDKSGGGSGRGKIMSANVKKSAVQKGRQSTRLQWHVKPITGIGKTEWPEIFGHYQTPWYSFESNTSLRGFLWSRKTGICEDEKVEEIAQRVDFIYDLYKYRVLSEFPMFVNNWQSLVWQSGTYAGIDPRKKPRGSFLLCYSFTRGVERAYRAQELALIQMLHFVGMSYAKRPVLYRNMPCYEVIIAEGRVELDRVLFLIRHMIYSRYTHYYDMDNSTRPWKPRVNVEACELFDGDTAETVYMNNKKQSERRVGLSRSSHEGPSSFIFNSRS